MQKEVLLYGSIYSYSASEFIDSINKAESENITVRVNSDGGEVRYGWGMISKFAELTGKKILKNDGEANSMAAFFFCYADDAEAADYSTFAFHRAGFPDWIESDPKFFSEADAKYLADMNKKLRAAFEAKVDVEAFNALGKGTVDEMFSMDGRKLITINAKEAKKVGLINRVIPITPVKKKEIEAHLFEVTAKYSGIKIAAKIETNNQNKTIMNQEILKTEHPAVYAAVIALGVEQGIAKEKSRVEVWAHYSDVDAKAVKEGIASGKEISQLQIIEMTEKKFASAKKIEIEGEGAPIIESVKTETLTAEQKKEAEKKAETDKFLAEANTHRVTK